jgi:hypothetical protein
MTKGEEKPVAVPQRWECLVQPSFEGVNNAPR